MAIITVSSLLGSGRSTVARPLAERLGYAFVDKEAIFAAAEDYGWLKRSLAKMDERHVSFWERSEADRRNYLTLVEGIITDFARRDNVIIVGRGGGSLEDLAAFNETNAALTYSSASISGGHFPRVQFTRRR